MTMTTKEKRLANTDILKTTAAQIVQLV